MACCLTAPSHYLNQCSLITSKVLWHSSEDIIIRRFEDTNQYSKIEDYIFKITLRSPRGHWVNNFWFWHEHAVGHSANLSLFWDSITLMRNHCNVEKKIEYSGICLAVFQNHIKSLRTKCCKGNIKTYLHFMSLLHIDMTQVLKIPPQVRPGPTYST